MESLLSTYTPTIPQKCIFKQSDIDIFTRSKAFERLMTFIGLLNTSVTQKKISDPCRISEVSKRLSL